MIKIVCKKKIWSLNQRDSAHWAVRRKDKTDWRRIICSQTLSGGPLRKPTDHRTVHIVSYRTRLLDDDNMIGGAKGLRDCLVDLHLIAGDRLQDATFIYGQVKCKRDDERTVIEIEGSDDG